MVLVPTRPLILCLKKRRQKEVETADAFVASVKSLVIAEILEMRMHSKYYSKEKTFSESLRGLNSLFKLFITCQCICKGDTRVTTDMQ